MKSWIICVILIIASCDAPRTEMVSGIVEEAYDTLPDFKYSTERSCEGITAEHFENLNELIIDFKNSSKYHDKFELNLRIGTYYFEREIDDSTFYYFNKALSIDSTDYLIHYDLALYYSLVKKYDSALFRMNKAMSICGERPRMLNHKSYYLAHLGRCEEAIIVSKRSIYFDPNQFVPYGNMTACFDHLNKKDSVLKYLRIIDSKFDIEDQSLTRIKEEYIEDL